MYRIILILLTVCTIVPTFATDFTWDFPKIQVKSDVPGDWTAENQMAEFGPMLVIKAPGNYAYMALIEFGSGTDSKTSFGSLNSVCEWVETAHKSGGWKTVSKTTLTSEQLKRCNASEGVELHYTWVNGTGAPGQTVSRVLNIGNKFYEFRLHATDAVMSKMEKKLLKYYDSLKLKR